MQSVITRLLLALATVSLLIALYVAFAATRDCDLADVVLILALPGFIMTVLVAAFLLSNLKPSIKSPLWIFIFILLAGFTFVGFERSHLNRIAVGDCE